MKEFLNNIPIFFLKGICEAKQMMQNEVIFIHLPRSPITQPASSGIINIKMCSTFKLLLK